VQRGAQRVESIMNVTFRGVPLTEELVHYVRQFSDVVEGRVRGRARCEVVLQAIPAMPGWRFRTRRSRRATAIRIRSLPSAGRSSGSAAVSTTAASPTAKSPRD
jgi:hypothetical protein